MPIVRTNFVVTRDEEALVKWTKKLWRSQIFFNHWSFGPLLQLLQIEIISECISYALTCGINHDRSFYCS